MSCVRLSSRSHGVRVESHFVHIFSYRPNFRVARMLNVCRRTLAALSIKCHLHVSSSLAKHSSACQQRISRNKARNTFRFTPTISNDSRQQELNQAETFVLRNRLLELFVSVRREFKSSKNT